MISPILELCFYQQATKFLILNLKCYICNARVTRPEFWKVSAAIVSLLVTTVAVLADFSVIKNSPVNLLGAEVQTEERCVTSIVCPEQFVHLFYLQKVLYDTNEHIQ